jgi:phosphoribosylaminoimidazolecarboxamide formyltransferase / IMP cyclohydrolase
VLPELAEELSKVFLELVIAPSFHPGALSLLQQKKNLRLLEIPGLESAHSNDGYQLRSIGGGVLLQDRDVRPFDPSTWKVATKRAPTPEERATMLFAARCVKHVKSNAVVFAKGTHTVGIGGGQTARVDSAWIAAHKGKENLRGSVMASEAFFPFRDAVDVAAENGVTAIIQPGGSVRDADVIEAADEHGMAMLFSGHRSFRH